MFKEPCPKCNGTKYIKAYGHISGGVCFKCSGTGYVQYKTSPESREKARNRRLEKRNIEKQAKYEAGKTKEELLFNTYKNDSRIGTSTKKSCEKSEAYSFEVYTLLSRIDASLLDNQTASRLLNNISN